MQEEVKSTVKLLTQLSEKKNTVRFLVKISAFDLLMLLSSFSFTEKKTNQKKPPVSPAFPAILVISG